MPASFIARSARAIDEEPAIRRYALVLSLVHALTGVAWFSYKNVASLTTGEDCVCWPLWPTCDRIRPFLSPDLVRGGVALYIGLGLAAAALFAARRPRSALTTFVAATILGTAIYSLDYRMRMNQTYMFGWAVLALLFAPKKTYVLQATVALFYVWAGTLKFNREWMSGAALYGKPFLIPEALVPASCVYVLVLETILVWSLFSASHRVRLAVYLQLLLFHAVSWNIVGYFYPLLMFGLTAIYPLVWPGVWLGSPAPGQVLTWARLREDRSALLAVGGVAAIFSAFQLVPHFFPGDTAVTGEGRLFALHMFDARTQCAGGATVRSRGGDAHVALINDNIDARTRCDPIALLATGHRLCRALAGRADVSVDVAIDAKRSTDAEMQPLIHVDDFCRKDLGYSLWHHNEWMNAR